MATLGSDLTHLAGRRVLITGHTGFKGSWLAHLLQQAGANVVGVALAPPATPSHFELLGLAHRIDSRICDIRDLSSLRRIFMETRPDVVFHLAAQAFVRQSYRDPHGTFSTNVLGSANLLECVRATDSIQALVFVTSDKCYKNKEQQHGYKETDELGGVDPYSVSKAAAELVFSGYVASVFQQSDSPRVASARAGNVIGGGDWSPDRLIPDCIRALTSGRAIEIRHPRATRPWQHVLEPLSGYIRLAVALLNGAIASGGSWNFGPPENTVHEVEKVARTVAAEWGSPSLVHVTPDTTAMYESQLLQLNSEKARQQLEWSVCWSFEQTMKHTVGWYRALHDGVSAMDLTTNDINAYLSS